MALHEEQELLLSAVPTYGTFDINPNGTPITLNATDDLASEQATINAALGGVNIVVAFRPSATERRYLWADESNHSQMTFTPDDYLNDGVESGFDFQKTQSGDESNPTIYTLTFGGGIVGRVAFNSGGVVVFHDDEPGGVSFGSQGGTTWTTGGVAGVLTFTSNDNGDFNLPNPDDPKQVGQPVTGIFSTLTEGGSSAGGGGVSRSRVVNG